MRIWLSTAPLAFRLKGAGGGTVDNRNQRQGLHLRNPKTCPNKPGHLYPPNHLETYVFDLAIPARKFGAFNLLDMIGQAHGDCNVPQAWNDNPKLRS
jgi:hypothetical protein